MSNEISYNDRAKKFADEKLKELDDGVKYINTSLVRLLITQAFLAGCRYEIDEALSKDDE